ncbi:hypothetical protein Dimus_006171 [Dionaea muscipula]
MDAGKYSIRSVCVEEARKKKAAGEYGEMIGMVDHLVKENNGRPLDYSGAKLLVEAHKAKYSTLRKKWLALPDVVEDDDGKKRREEIKSDMIGHCEGFINMLVKHAIPRADTSTGADASIVKVILLRSLGDFHRYVAELKAGCSVSEEEARRAYEQAQEIARNHLKPISKERLILALNFFALCKDELEANLIIKEAFYEAYEYKFNGKNGDVKIPDTLFSMWEKIKERDPDVKELSFTIHEYCSSCAPR